MKNLRRYDKNEISAVSKVIKEGKYLSGFTTKFHGGEEVQKFEKEFAKYIGTKYALTFNSGTSALYVAISSIIEYGNIQFRMIVSFGICLIQLNDDYNYVD